MRILIKLLIKLLPWIILLLAFFFILKIYPGWPFDKEEEEEEVIAHNTILESIESMGKLELIKYNFQEITELTQKNRRYLGVFPSGDSKAVLISHGEAVGCIDLTQIEADDILLSGDSLIVIMPPPQICYYKLNMEKTRIYSIEKGVYYRDERELIEKAYKLAEAQIKKAALTSGIREKTLENAELILKPLLEKISDKKVYFSHRLDQGKIQKRRI